MGSHLQQKYLRKQIEQTFKVYFAATYFQNSMKVNSGGKFSNLQYACTPPSYRLRTKSRYIYCLLMHYSKALQSVDICMIIAVCWIPYYTLFKFGKYRHFFEAFFDVLPVAAPASKVYHHLLHPPGRWYRNRNQMMRTVKI